MSFSGQLSDTGDRRAEGDYVDVPLCYSLSDSSGGSGPLNYLSADLANASRPCPVPLPSPIKTAIRTPKSNSKAQKSPITSPGGAGGVLRAMILLRGGANRRTKKQHRRGASSLSSIDMTACCEDSHCSEEDGLFGEIDDVVFDLPNFDRLQFSKTPSGRIVPSPPPPSLTYNNNKATIRAATRPMRIHPLLRKNHPVSPITSTNPAYENNNKAPLPPSTPTRGGPSTPTRGSPSTPTRGGSTRTETHHTPTRGTTTVKTGSHAGQQGEGKKLSPPRLHMRRISRQGQPPPSQY